MTPPFDRREFVRLSSVAALAGPALLGACADEPVVEPSTCGTGAPDQGVLWDENPLELVVDSTMFPLPPQSGAMRSESALIWGYADGPEALKFWVWREEAEQRFLVHSGTAQLVEGYAKVALEALAAGQWYEYLWYHEDADGGTQRGVAGRFRTAFEPGCSAPIVVAATSCTNRRLAPYRSLEMMADAQPDMFLQLGDMSYNDGAQDQQEYRDLWHETLSDPGYAAILAKCGMYVTWDDHEIVDSSSYYNTGETRRRIATEAWFETLATPRLEADRFWDSYRWGDTAEFFVLDCRSERQPESRRTPEAAYISRAQMDWLKAGLSSSTATWKVILNSVPMTNWPDVTILESDRWEGYEAQRQELVDYLVAEDLDGVLVVSGDFHCGSVSRLEPVGPARKYFEVLVGPGANGGNPLAYLYQMGSEAERGRIFEGDQFAFLHHGMSTTLLTFDGDAQSVAIQFVDPETEEERFSAVIYADGRIVS
jgi:alkaline phosphatase D